VRLSHFEAIRPICPVCAAAQRPPAFLRILHRERATADEIIDGSLSCSAPSCRFEFPIIDGLPIIVASLREVVASQLPELRARDDLSPYVESFLADCAGPGSEFERQRYQVGAYAHGHWGDLVDPALGDVATVSLIRRALGLVNTPFTGTWLDAGCSLGRGTVELIRAGATLALGIDLNLAMLRTARSALGSGRLRYALRRVGVTYDVREIDLGVTAAEAARIDLWACDAMSLPLSAATLDGVVSLNVLDVVQFPLNHLAEVSRVLRPHAHAVFSTPFDWAASATPFEAWIGGHTQRAPMRGSSQQELARILGSEDPAGLQLRSYASADVPWEVHVHERAAMRYRAHVVAAARQPG
jgi:SAM-dependent methyltransferase